VRGKGRRVRAGGAALRLSGEEVMTDSKKGSDLNAYRIKTTPDVFDAFRIALGYRVGNLIFLSGQASIDENGELVGVGDFDRQVEQTFANIKRVLEAAGSSMEKIVKVTIYLTDMANFPKIIEARGKYFKQPWPADTIVEVGALGLPELQIEIEVVALIEGEVIG
jgi:2-iminobutanoate/2-iminopropanoate deaminase